MSLPSFSLLSRRASHLTILIIQFHNFITTVVLIPGKIKISGNLPYSFLSVQTGTRVNSWLISHRRGILNLNKQESVLCWESETLVWMLSITTTEAKCENYFLKIMEYLKGYVIFLHLYVCLFLSSVLEGGIPFSKMNACACAIDFMSISSPCEPFDPLPGLSQLLSKWGSFLPSLSLHQPVLILFP